MVALELDQRWDIRSFAGTISNDSVDDTGDTDPNIQAPLTPEQLTLASIGVLGANDRDVGVVELNAQSFVVARYRLGRLASGTSLDMFLLKDFTAQNSAKNEAIRTALIGVAIVTLLFLVAMLVWIRSQMRPLKQNTDALTV